MNHADRMYENDDKAEFDKDNIVAVGITGAHELGHALGLEHAYIY